MHDCRTSVGKLHELCQKGVPRVTTLYASPYGRSDGLPESMTVLGYNILHVVVTSRR